MMRGLLIAQTAMVKNSLRESLRIANKVQEAKRTILKRAKVRSPMEVARITTRMVLTFDC
jgi:hypothetical protein